MLVNLTPGVQTTLNISLFSFQVTRLLINACPNLRVLKISLYGRKKAYCLFDQIISKCTSLEIFFFSSGLAVTEPISISNLAPKICQNLKNLTHLNLPGWHISDDNLKLLKQRKPSLRMVRVNHLMLVSANVLDSELQMFFNEFDNYCGYEAIENHFGIQITK